MEELVGSLLLLVLDLRQTLAVTGAAAEVEVLQLRDVRTAPANGTTSQLNTHEQHLQVAPPQLNTHNKIKHQQRLLKDGFKCYY